MVVNKVHPEIEDGDANSNMQEETPGRCGRFRAEFSLPIFGLEDVNGKTLDLNKSFCTERSGLALLTKFVLWGLVVGTLIGGWIDSPHPHYYMAHLSKWTLLFFVVYQSLSLLLSTGCCSAKLFIKTAWIMFSIASVHGILVVLMFWALEYDKENYTITYFIIMYHAGGCAIVLLDGLLVNRVPVRMHHMWFNIMMALLFVVWSIIASTVPVDNPYIEDHDGLYDFLDWKGDPGYAAVCSLIPVFVGCPIFQTLLWALSICNRRYVATEEEKEDGNNGCDEKIGDSIGDGEEML